MSLLDHGCFDALGKFLLVAGFYFCEKVTWVFAIFAESIAPEVLFKPMKLFRVTISKILVLRNFLTTTVSFMYLALNTR